MKYRCPKCFLRLKPSHNGNTVCRCGYRFVFDSKEYRPVDDFRFFDLLKSVNVSGTTYYTKNQLYTKLCDTSFPGKFDLTFILVGLFVLCIAVGLAYLCYIWDNNTGRFILGFISVVLFITGIGPILPQTIPISKDRLDELIAQWKKIGKPMGPYIEELSLKEPPPDWKAMEKNFEEAERILVVQRDILVDLFIKNRFHQKHNTIIISMNGYPDYHIPAVKKALTEKKQLPVYYLFDSMKIKPNLSLYLADKGITISRHHPIIECGLTPSQVESMGELNIINPAESKFEVPVDVLLYPSLEEKILFCFENNVPMGVSSLDLEIIRRKRQRRRYGSNLPIENLKFPYSDDYYNDDYYDVDNDDMDDDDDDGDDGDD